MGKVDAGIVNPGPLTLMPLMVTAPVPVELRVMAFVDELLSVMLPKLKLSVLTVSCGTVAVTPVPVKATFAVEALLMMVSVPEEVPAALGSKPTRSDRVAPGFSVTGNTEPDTT
jgi:hypothetical protein